MSDSYDLLILGSGPAATRVATRAAAQGWRTAVIDPVPIGGTCALRGCNPKKVLVRAAELVDRAVQMQGNGTRLRETRIDWPQLIEFKRKFTDPVTPGKEQSFREQGIEIIRGDPRFTAATVLEVAGRSFQAKHILIATGASPVELPFEGAELLSNSAEFMELESLPPRIVFVGGGYVSFEFAHVAARAGAEVTVIERSRPLARFDSDLVNRLVSRSRKIGIDVRVETSVNAVEELPNGMRKVHLESPTGEEAITASLVVHGAGRRPNLTGLDLERAGVASGEKGVLVNEYLQSVSNPAVYAAGDAADAGLAPLTPAANYQADVVATNLLEGNRVRNELPWVPSAVFTVPSLAAVGRLEGDAKQSGIDCKVLQGDWSTFSSMKKIGETHAGYKILVDQQDDRILGAHLLGPEAAETINLFALAMKNRMTTTELKETLMVFPTFADDVRSML